MSKLDDLFAEAEAAPADTSKAKLNALFSEAEAAPTPQSKLRALFGDEGQGQGTEGRPRLGGGGAGSTIPLPFGLAPVPNPLALLQQARGLPGFETGAQIADVVSAIPHIIGETIKSTGRALPEVPRETLRIAQAMAGGQTIPVDIIKAQAEDVMQAQQGNQDAQDRINARSLIQSTVIAPIAGAAGAAAPALSATERMLLGGGLGAAQNVALAGAEGRPPSPVDIGAGFAFGALPAHGPTVQTPIPGVTPQAVMSAETQYAAKNLLEKLRSAKPLLGVQRRARRLELGRRTGAATEAAEGLAGRERLSAELRAIRGRLPRVDFDPLNLSEADDAALFSHLENLEASGQLRKFQSINARRALQSLLGEGGGALPRPHEIRLLGQAFGGEVADELVKKGATIAELNASKNLPQWRRLLKTTIGTTRELKATLDLSAPLRQGFFLTSHPREFFRAFQKMHGFARSQDLFDDAMTGIKQRPSYNLMREAGLDFADVGGPLQKTREEVFQGGLLEKLPRKFGGGLFRGSQRAYTGFLNQLRADVFDDMLRQGSKLGITPEDAAKHVADFVNAATGRGKLPGVLERNMELLSSVFFAPRLYGSRVGLLGTPLSYVKSLASGDKAYRFVRQQAMKDFIVAGGIATTALSLAAGAGAKVVSDPTHTDFGKFRMGNQTVDLLGGFGQFIRAGARIQAEQAYAQKTGKKGAQGSVIGRFARSKLSPVAQFATDLFLKEDYLGNKVTLPSAIWNLFSPLAIGDAIQAVRDNPVSSTVTVPLGIYGASTQTYKPPQPYHPGRRGY
jgi:hypothetical protein